MARCSVCGKLGLFARLTPCEACDKPTCPACGLFVGTMFSPQVPETNKVAWKTCSTECLDRLAVAAAAAVGPPTAWFRSGRGPFDEMRTSRAFAYWRRGPKRKRAAFSVTMLATSREFFETVQRAASLLIREGMLPEYDHDMTQADQKFRAARYEEAAQIYEKWWMHDEAGAARRSAQTQLIRRVQVDANRMLDQVRKDGLVLAYRCQSCGSSLGIDPRTPLGSLGTCGHCGTTYDHRQVTRLLAAALG